MLFPKPVLLISLLLIWSAGFVLADTDTIPPRIENPDTVPILYCADSVAVAPRISIQNIKIDEPDEGMKVSIVNYQRGEDLLVWDEVAPFIGNYRWNVSRGELEIRGVGTEEQYRNAISKIYYKNIAEAPNLDRRSFSISLLDADYLPATQHFYRYIAKLDISWTEARDSAANMRYYGLTGYLATITSKDENDFIWTKIDGVGWIGANDEAEEGRWIWATGPEAGTHFWQGNFSGSPINGRYSFWNNGEPNDLGGEDYGHINADPNTIARSWNDLRNNPDPGNPYYRAQGFVVEFGGMTGDPEVKLSAEASVEIGKIAFSDTREYEICAGEGVQINLKADDVYSYQWTPEENISSATASNPIVWPLNTSVYTAAGKLGECRDTADFTVNVNPLPISELIDTIFLCRGDTIDLSPGIHQSYLWSTGETTPSIEVSEEGEYWVRISNSFDCFMTDSFEVQYSEIPELDYTQVDTLICGTKTHQLTLAFVGGEEARTVLTALSTDSVTVDDPTSSNPTITVDYYGKYLFELKIRNEHRCQFIDTLNIEFHNQPEAIILMDEKKCKGYSLDVEYGGSQVEDALFTWLYNDSIYQSGINLDELTINLGFNEPGRSVGLLVNEQGCVADTTIPVSVTPDISVDADLTKGCTPLTVQLDARSTEPAQSYSWDFGDGNTSPDASTSNTYFNSGVVDTTFDVSLTVVSTEGCTNTGVLENFILVHPIPSVDFSFDESDCNQAEMEIWYTGSGSDTDRYNWDLGSFLSSEIVEDPGDTKGPLKINRISEPTAVIGLQVISEFACESDTVYRNWKRKPLFEIDVDVTEGCVPLLVNAKASTLDSVDLNVFAYELGDGSSGTGASFNYVFSEPNTKNFILFTANSSVTSCSQSLYAEDSVFVYPQPNAAFTAIPEAVIISEPDIYFENHSAGAEYYDWDFGDNSFGSIEENPTHSYTTMGFYNVVLLASNNYTCSDTATQRVAVAFDQLFPPNAFSPNSNLEEDREFRIHSEGIADEGYQLLIFNRWGEQIFESDSQNVGWDGKMQSDNFAPAGVYTWVLQYTDFRGEKHKQQGIVTLVF